MKEILVTKILCCVQIQYLFISLFSNDVTWMILTRPYMYNINIWWILFNSKWYWLNDL